MKVKSSAWTILPALSLLAWAGPLGPLAPQAPPSSAPRDVPFGFSPASYAVERGWEEKYLALPDAARCGKYLKQLTAFPHIAGTPGDRRVTELIYHEFERDGLKPEILEYKVLLSYPKKIEIEIAAPERVKLATPEPVIPGDKQTRVADPLARMPWNGYSPSADLTAPVVYVNYGRAEDYEQLESLGVSVKGKIALVRYFHGYRGGKSLEAERRRAAGVIVYSDPADDGASQGPTYPRGPWGPLGHFQRGAVVYDFIAPGDPLTPGWASTDGAKRIPESEVRILPKIPMAPLSAADAAQILRRLDGPAAPKEWQGALPLAYRLGGENVKVHLDLRMENRVTPIWDVIGKIQGSTEPEKWVVLSNHHDAWVYGAVDPTSGTATMLETARALGRLARMGFRPRRTLVLGSWDAEEYTLTGSTEWGEQFEDQLRNNGVACLNVDSATSGENFSPSVVPSLLRVLMEAAKTVRDPATGQTVFERWRSPRAATNIRSYAVAGATGGPVPFGLLGGGSDYMVFLQHDGVPSLDMIFDGPYGVYHSVYDDYAWMERFGDPGFRYHATMSRLWGLLALRMADAELFPLDYSAYATEVAAYLEGLEKLAPPDFFQTNIRPLIEKCRAWHDEAARITRALEAWGAGNPAPTSAAKLNEALAAQERAWLDDAGLPGRPWFRHLVYAPRPSYEAETLPGLREALEAKDLERGRREAGRLGKAMDRALAAIREKIPVGK